MFYTPLGKILAVPTGSAVTPMGCCTVSDLNGCGHTSDSVCVSQSARTSRNRQKERKQTNFCIHSSWSERQTDGLFHPDYPNLLNIEIQDFFSLSLLLLYFFL